MNTADQCRALGLNVGDTIEGKEGGDNWWNVTRLTLLWLGEREAVWSETHRTSKCDEWTAPRETANWTLSAREWRRIPPTGQKEGRDMDTIDIADKVKHLPSGETWVVSRVTERDVYPAGWPMSCGDLSDCVLVGKATPKEKADMIEHRKKLPRDDWRYLPQEQTP